VHRLTNPETARAYFSEITSLSGTPDAAYTRAKTSLIQELTDRARLARGLPSVPVWEE
jgi:hypothetical protein